MIDAHLHVVPPRLPGCGPLHPRLHDGPAAVADLLRGELADAGIKQCLAMGSMSRDDADPLGVQGTLAVAEHLSGLHAVGACDPTRTDPEHRGRVEHVLKTGRVKALKIYLGYLHYEPVHYRLYYELAERYQLPVVLHTGDTYSPLAKLRYSHPLGVDEVAVDHPKVKFVLAHVGNPWFVDAAAVVYKNVNVWTDVSGLVVGDRWLDPDEELSDQLNDVRAGLLRALRYSERPNRFLFGTDWPLVPVKAYRDLIAGWLPEHTHELVFEQNAKTLFRL